MEVWKHFDKESVSSIQLGGFGTFWNIRTFLVKKSYMSEYLPILY